MKNEWRGSFKVSRSDAAADNYDKSRFQSRRMKKNDRVEREFACQARAMAGKDAVILDIPCGNGRFFDIFKDAKDLYLFDYDIKMIEALLRKHPEAGRFKSRQADVLAIPLETDSVDLAFCMRLFHHISNDQTRLKALSELARVSRRYVALSFYCKESWRYLKRKLRGKTPSGFSVAMSQFLREAEQCNLALVMKQPAFELLEQQRCLLFEKKRPAA